MKQAFHKLKPEEKTLLLKEEKAAKEVRDRVFVDSVPRIRALFALDENDTLNANEVDALCGDLLDALHLNMDQLGSLLVSRRERLLSAAHFHNATSAAQLLQSTGAPDSKLFGMKELKSAAKSEKEYRNLESLVNSTFDKKTSKDLSFLSANLGTGEKRSLHRPKIHRPTRRSLQQRRLPIIQRISYGMERPL